MGEDLIIFEKEDDNGLKCKYELTSKQMWRRRIISLDHTSIDWHCCQGVSLGSYEGAAVNEKGGLTIRKVKEALPTVVKVVSLVNIDRKELFRTGPKMYTREEVAEEGLLWGQVHCSPLGHADSQPYPSEEIVHQFFKEVEVDNGLIAVHCAHGLNRTGYLICRYLIQKCGVEPREAVARCQR